MKRCHCCESHFMAIAFIHEGSEYCLCAGCFARLRPLIDARIPESLIEEFMLEKMWQAKPSEVNR